MRAVVIAINYFHSPLILIFHRLSQLHHRGGGVGLVGLFLALAALSKESHLSSMFKTWKMLAVECDVPSSLQCRHLGDESQIIIGAMRPLRHQATITTDRRSASASAVGRDL